MHIGRIRPVDPTSKYLATLGCEREPAEGAAAPHGDGSPTPAVPPGVPSGTDRPPRTPAGASPPTPAATGGSAAAARDHSVSATRIAGRLRAHLSAWRRLGADPQVLSWIEHGYEIPFSHDPRDVPRYHAPQNGPGCQQYAAWLRRTVPELIAVGAVQRVSFRPHVVALVNVVEKATPGKYRLIVDLRPLNKHVEHRRFRYETHATYRDLIEVDDDMIAFDFCSGYYHVDVLPAHRTFLGCRIFGEYYVFCVLPFGLRDACYAFTQIVKVPVRYLRSRGFRVLPYLDDLLVSLRGMAQADADEVLQLLQALGFLINFAKSVLSPTKRIENLGFIVDTRAMTYELTPKRRAKFEAAVERAFAELSVGGSVSARAIAKVTGHIAAAALAFERKGRLFSRYLNDAIRDAAAARAWEARVPLSPEALAELSRWRAAIPDLEPAPIRRPTRPATTVLIASDASDFAWGGRVLWAAPGVFPRDAPTPIVRGVFSAAESQRSSTWRELRGMRRVLGGVISAGLHDQVVTHQTDNQGADFCYRNAGSQNRGDDGDLDLQPEVLALDESAAEAHLDYSTTWVPREENQDADDDSKIRDPGNYSVSADTFRWIEAHFGSHDVDLFADGDNHLLPRFVSRYCAEGAEAVDAFSVSWSQGVNWLHPPFSVLARVVGKLRDDRGRGTLLVPRFPSASWWPALFPRRGHQPVLRQLTIPAGRHTFVAHEPAAALGHGDFPPATMIALQMDFAAA